MVEKRIVLTFHQTVPVEQVAVAVVVTLLHLLPLHRLPTLLVLPPAMAKLQKRHRKFPY